MITLDQKISSLCIYGFEGLTPDDLGVQTIKQQIDRLKIGGVIFYSRNIENPHQVKALTTFLQQDSQDFKPFLSIDQEGGQVQRLRPAKGFKGGPSARDISKIPLEEAYGIYNEMATELKGLGFNLNFAPDLDLHLTDAEGSVIGPLDRSYGAQGEVVIQYGAQWIKALRHHGILNSIKHFPGHGSATKDSHAGFVDVTETWTPQELEPFFHFVKKEMVDTVMTAHIYNQQLDSKYPATFSSATLHMLRDQGYEGVIISDDLHMGAVLESFDIVSFQEIHKLKHAIVDALKAGNDMLIFSQNPLAAKTISDFKVDINLPEKVVTWVMDAIKAGEISLEKIEASFQRVQALKEKI